MKGLVKVYNISLLESNEILSRIDSMGLTYEVFGSYKLFNERVIGGIGYYKFKFGSYNYIGLSILDDGTYYVCETSVELFSWLSGYLVYLDRGKKLGYLLG